LQKNRNQSGEWIKKAEGAGGRTKTQPNREVLLAARALDRRDQPEIGAMRSPYFDKVLGPSIPTTHWPFRGRVELYKFGWSAAHRAREPWRAPSARQTRAR